MHSILKYLGYILLITVSGFGYSYSEKEGFAFSEHLAAGEQIALSFSTDRPAEKNTRLHLPNGLYLSYAEIISLGDLYGIPEKPIHWGSTQAEKEQRFLAAFATLASDAEAVSEARLLKKVIYDEWQAVQEGMRTGQTPEEIFKTIGSEVGRQVNCITGGGCQPKVWWLLPGRYLKLAMENYDHFAFASTEVWRIGHRLALRQALLAHQTGLRRDLEYAYALEAFAAHYLSDRFAAGHLRTPRTALAQKVSPSLLGSLLANYMHNEDNLNGLYVYNENQDHWQVFGDFSYFNPLNEINRQTIRRVIQASADEIFAAFYSGIMPQNSPLERYLPVAEKGNINFTPMFCWSDAQRKLLRRKDLADPHSREMSNNWWGWSTLWALQSLYSSKVSILQSAVSHKIESIEAV